MKNDAIWDWFNHDNIVEAILGEDKYFIPDVTYIEEHDSLLVIRQLLLWSSAMKKEQYAADIFESAILELLSSNKMSIAIKTLIAYRITTSSIKLSLPLNTNKIANAINSAINYNSSEICKDEYLRDMVVYLATLWPDLIKTLLVK